MYFEKWFSYRFSKYHLRLYAWSFFALSKPFLRLLKWPDRTLNLLTRSQNSGSIILQNNFSEGNFCSWTLSRKPLNHLLSFFLVFSIHSSHFKIKKSFIFYCLKQKVNNLCTFGAIFFKLSVALAQESNTKHRYNVLNKRNSKHHQNELSPSLAWDILHLCNSISFQHDQHDNYSWEYPGKSSLILTDVFMKSCLTTFTLFSWICWHGLQKYFYNNSVRNKVTILVHVLTQSSIVWFITFEHTFLPLNLFLK